MTMVFLVVVQPMTLEIYSEIPQLARSEEVRPAGSMRLVADGHVLK